MEVYWLEQTEADAPPDDEWLSAREREYLSRLKFSKRRTDWRLGRWTAKRALSAYFNIPISAEALATIEVRPSASGAPEPFLADAAANATISLSHRCGIALCAVSLSGVNLGCDVELVEPRSPAFIGDYFAVEEQQALGKATVADRDRLTTLIWSGKESALKALHAGLRLDTRSVIVRWKEAHPVPNGWVPLQVRHTDEIVFDGWWQPAGNTMRTIVANPALNHPTQLLVSPYYRQVADCA